MPSKKKKYNARFPAGRIKKIMQSDEEVGKVAQAVPIIISRTLELFVESLLTKTLKITNSRNAKTLSTSHMKQCIMSEQRFDFLRELVRTIPDISVAEEAANYNEEDNQSSPEEQYPDSDTPYDLSMPSTSLRATARQQMVSSSSSSSNGHNGGHTHHHHNHQMHQQQQQQLQQQQQHHDYQRNYLKRSISSNPNSVIRHTTSVAQTNVECLPAKLSRSDSAPVPPQLLSSSSSPSSSVYHPRLKHQSYSMPSSNNDNNNKPNTHTPPKQLQSPLQQTAIPAPIVSIDYCSKPVVKIDYSNLAPNNANVASLSAPVGPLSAPANISCISGNNTPFNFSAEPVINIDLSNIVAAASAGVGAAAITPLVPNVATISIGTSPLTIAPPPPPQPLTTSSLNKTKLFAANAVDQQSRNSKAKMAEPLTTSITKSKTNNSSNLNAIAAATTMTTTTISNSDSYLDMDEDYDNI